MKKTKLVSSTFHNFTMNTEQSKAIYATEVVLKTPPTAQLYVLKESQTLTGRMWNWRNQARVKTSPHSSFTVSAKPWILQKCWSEGTQS